MDNATLPAENKIEIYDVPVGLIVFLSIFYGMVSLIAVFGNCLVIWIVATSRRLQTVTNFFIANLACADIIIGIFSIPFQFQAALLQYWGLPYFMCPLCPFVQVLSVNVSVFSLTAIALERYRAIMHPLKARTTKFRSKIVILCIWICASGAAVPYAVALRVALIFDPLTGNFTKPFCKNVGISLFAWKIYNYLLVGVQYILPLFIIIYVYGRMGMKLRKDETPGNAQDSRDVGLLRNRRKVIKMLLIVVGLFVFCWLPFQAYNFLQEVFPKINEYKYINVIWFFCHWLAMSNSCCNCFVYAIYNDHYQKVLKSRFPCCLKRHVRPFRMDDLETNICRAHVRQIILFKPHESTVSKT